MTVPANRLSATLGVLLGVVALLVASACGSGQPLAYDYIRVFLHEQGVLGLTKQHTDPTRIAVYFHGLDNNEKVLLDDAHRPLVDSLVNDGFAVVASNAGGNVFGNEDSQEDYLQLIQFAQEHYGGPLPVYFIAESMGAVAAANLYAKVPGLDVLGMVGISPALDFGVAQQDLQPAIAAAYAPESPATMNPLDLPPKLLAGKHFRFWASPQDTFVPAATNATAFEQQFGSVADVTVATCTGDHADPSCMPPGQILDWLNGL
jgi:pimeloyl-ACP methyl ester carboxylesterase